MSCEKEDSQAKIKSDCKQFRKSYFNTARKPECEKVMGSWGYRKQYDKDDGNQGREDTQDTISQGETSCNGSQHQDTVGMERVPPDIAAYKSYTIGTKENWEEDYRDQKVTRDRKTALYAGNPHEEVKGEYM